MIFRLDISKKMIKFVRQILIIVIELDLLSKDRDMDKRVVILWRIKYGYCKLLYIYYILKNLICCKNLLFRFCDKYWYMYVDLKKIILLQ